MAGKALMTETVEATGRGQGGGRSRGFGAEEVEEVADEVETSTVGATRVQVVAGKAKEEISQGRTSNGGPAAA